MPIEELSDSLREYYFGTETRRAYLKYTSLAREIVQDYDSLHRILESAAASYYQEIIVGKYIPNALLIISFISMHSVGVAGAIFVLGGETLRWTRHDQGKPEELYQKLLKQFKSETASQASETEFL